MNIGVKSVVKTLMSALDIIKLLYIARGKLPNLYSIQENFACKQMHVSESLLLAAGQWTSLWHLEHYATLVTCLKAYLSYVFEVFMKNLLFF